MATHVPPPARFEASLIVGDHVNLVLHAQQTAVEATYHIDDPNNTGGSHQPAYAGDIEEAKRVAVAVAEAHARHVLSRAGSTQQIPPITWHAV